jgi:hypothetical protein
MAQIEGGDTTRYIHPDNVARIGFIEQVATGRVRNWTVVHNFGHNDAVGLTEEDLWEEGGVMVWPAAAATISIVSTDAADDAVGGTGLKDCEVRGLDANWNEIREVVQLDGLTPVVTANLFLRVNSVEGGNVGTGGVNAGTITGTLTGNVIFHMSIGDGVDHSSHFSVPAGHRGYLVKLSTWQGQDQSASVGFVHREFGKSWVRLMHMATYRNQATADVNWAEVMGEKSDMKMVATADVGNVDQGGYYICLLEKYA